MSDFDRIYDSYKKEIEEQAKVLNQSQHVEIPRDSMRRPWSSEFDFLEERERPKSSKDLLEKTFRESVISLPWYGTARGLWTYLRRRTVSSLGFFFAGLALFGYLSSLVPTRFYATAHLFVPAKIDSVSARLSTFMEKADFASMPVDLKTPVTLIAKDLESLNARRWVIENLPAGIDPSTVSVDSGYGLGSETLVIHGFASQPESAVEVARLYKKYFENKVQALRQEQLARMDKWADLRLVKVCDEIEALRPQMLSFSTVSSNHQKVANIQQKLSDKAAELVIKKINLQRLRNQLLAIGSLDSVKNIDNSELQEMLDIYHGLESQEAASSGETQTNSLYGSEKRKLEVRIRQLIGDLNRTSQKDIQDLELEISKIQSEVARYGSQESDIRFANGQELGLNQKIASLESQKEDLLKLKNQIQLDMSTPSGQYKVIQEPAADIGTRTPSPFVRFGVIFFASLVLAVIGLIGLQFIRPLNMAKWHSARDL